MNNEINYSMQSTKDKQGSLSMNDFELGEEQSEIVVGADKTAKVILATCARAKVRWSCSADSVTPAIVMSAPEYIEALRDMRSRGIRTRYITEITRNNLRFCKQLQDLVDLRHFENIKGGFAVTENEYLIAPVAMKEGRRLTQILHSTRRQVVEMHQYLFDALWSKAIPSKERIAELEKGLLPQRTEVFHGTEVTTNVIIQSFSNTKECLCLFAESAGPSVAIAVDSYKKAFIEMKKRKVRIRVITEISNENLEYTRKLMDIVDEVRH